uniref:prenyltransferase/squalene oxidase repeat-containing protein n=1 Tax=Candidatus Laterigemmans baculatus TaxID=2770505 RepID=UPI0013DD807E|nr:prenyltransferase/squalene oxidase repeat-containing protein [Candidatus Laterigemmans baculatus]
MAYLTDLTLRLALGTATLPPELRSRHLQYLLAQQRPDGGFGGREGGSDPYYTGFALRALMVLGELQQEPAERAARFLASRLTGREGIVDLISLVFAAAVVELGAGVDVLREAPSDWPQNLAKLLETYRRDDGGYAKSPDGRAGSTYQTFLTILCYELLEIEPAEVDRAIAFLREREHPDGGFLEIRVGKRPGVNPTAAAIGALKTLGALQPPTIERTVEFLLDQQSDDGGFTANTRIPLADLLSTCTATITLADLGARDAMDVEAARKYVLSMERPSGGFAGFLMDPAQDVEYTFYGLATLALLA